jgi:hypothetical protein
MRELLGWTMLTGMAVGLLGLSMLYGQVEHETRSAIDAALRRIMGHLEERKRSTKGRITVSPHARPRRGRPGKADRRTFPRRRLEDLFPSRKFARASE